MGLDNLEKKIADHYNKDHAQGQAPAQQQPAPQQQQPAPQQQQAPPPEEHKHHMGGVVGKLGNAAMFGAGATAGADAVNGLLGR